MSLAAERISFAYPNGRALYRGFSLAVEPGERVALAAPSGSGKTTLCRLLAGYLEPDGGTVSVDGVPLVPLSRRRGAAARRPMPVQLLAQHPEQAFDPRLPMEKSMREGSVAGPSDVLLSRFGVRPEWLSRFPHELSGGELMRLAMVRALAARPRYLIADESTAMLDAVTQVEIWRALMRTADADGLGIVLVSHSPALVRRVATRVATL